MGPPQVVRTFILCLFLVGSLLQTRGYAGEGRWEEPWGRPPSSPGNSIGRLIQQPSAGQKISAGLIKFFREYISPVDGDRCPSYPTCSQYSLEAIQKHGVLVGMVMTFDRLIHESDEIRLAPTVKVNDSYRHYDPVENNDFWWDKDSIQQSAKE